MKSTKSILLTVLLVAAGHSILKYGLNRLGELSFSGGALATSLLTIFSSPFVWLGIISFGLSSVLWLTSLSKNDLSYAFPFLSLSYALVAVFSWLVLGESFSMVRLLGIGVICGGIILMSRS